MHGLVVVSNHVLSINSCVHTHYRGLSLAFLSFIRLYASVRWMPGTGSNATRQELPVPLLMPLYRSLQCTRSFATAPWSNLDFLHINCLTRHSPKFIALFAASTFVFLACPFRLCVLPLYSF